MIAILRSALRRLRSRHGGVAAVGALFLVVGATAALAYWTTTGNGTAAANAATLSAPTGVTGTPAGSTVTVGFTGVAPPAGTLTGYYVTRYLGATASNACGTTPGVTASYLGFAATSCADTGVANGTYTYTVTAVFRTWTGTSAASANVVVNSDPTPPTQVVSLVSGAGTSYLGAGTVYYRGDLAGTFTLSDAVSDSGSGPASATYPVLASAGWTHTAELVTTGTGSAPTITYTSGTYGWGIGATSPGTHTVTGRDAAGNTVTTNLAFASDVSSPTGGALVVAGTTGTAGGATAFSTTGTFTGTRTDYSADTGSGFLSSTLRREAGTLANGVCSAYAAPTVVVGAPSETTLANGCYRYTLTGLDRVGNASVLTTIVQVDTTAPTQAVTETGANSYVSGATLYYKSNVAGSFTLTSAVTDSGSGPKQVAFPAIGTAGWTHNLETVAAGTGAAPTISYTSSTYSWTANPTNPTTLANRTMTATDLAGNTGTSALTFTADIVAPVTGAMTLNTTAATGGGSTSTSATGTFTGSRTDWTDATSGIASSTLTREVGTLSGGVCSAYAAPTTVVGVPTETGLLTGCYRYTLTGTDNVGNTSVVSTVVQVDRTGPTQVLTETGANAFLTGGTLYYRGVGAGSFTLTSTLTDGELGPKQAAFPAIATTGWTHNAETVTVGTGAVPTIAYTSSTFSWTASPSNPATYTVTGSDQANNTVATGLTFTADNTAPTGGALSANGQSATAGGTTSVSNTGTYTGTYTPYTDAGSGIAAVNGNRVTREIGTLTNGVCSAYAAPVDVAWTSETGLPTGCYRYTAIGLDNVGNTASVSTVVLVDRANPTQTLTGIGTNAALVGSTLYFDNTVPGSFVLSATVTDGQTGPASATFPTLTATNWTHANEVVSSGTGSVPAITYPSSAFSWTAGAATPGSYTVTGADVAGNTVGSAITFATDTSNPTGGSLVVNGVTATGGGATGYSGTGTFTGTRVDYSADTGSGVSTSVLTREVGTLTNGVCSAYGAPSTVVGVPTETAVASGCYRYTLTGTDRVGNATSVSTVIQVDSTGPSQIITETGGPGSVTGTTVYYKSNAAGSFTLTSTVTDNGAGPKQVLFPAIGTAGWTHNAETVTTGTGTNPSIAYTSSTYSWTANPTNPTVAANRTLTATDQAGNTGTVALTFTPDNAVPTGGALNLNATAATAGGSTSRSATGTFTGTRTDFTDALSGIASSVVTREVGTLNNGACTGYAAATTVAGVPNETALATGCYRYVLTGTDNVGNTTTLTTVVQVDRANPTQVLTDTGANSAMSGGTLYYRGGSAGSLTLTSAVTDGESGPASALFPAIATAGWTHNTETVSVGAGAAPTTSYTSSTFSWTASPTNPTGYSVTGADAAGNTVVTAVPFAADNTAPTGGALTVNTVVGTAGGATGYSNTGTYTGTFTNFNADTGSGFASSALTREYAAALTNGVCGAYAAPTTIGTITETSAAAGCYRYTLTGTDNVGNVAVLSVIVQVDKTNPTMTITDTSPNASYNVGTNTMYYRGGLSSTFNWTASVTDNASGPKQVAYPAIATTGWTHNAETVTTGTGAAPTIAYASSPYTWTASPTNPTGAVRTITGSDLAGNTVAITPTFLSDTTAPTGGALTVNAVAATGGGSTSTSSATSWTIGTRTDYNADTGSGFSSSVLTREAAPWNGTTCGTYAAPTTITGTTAQTGMAGGYCYRYVLTGTDNVGNVATLTTVVRTNLLITSVTLNNGTTGTSGTLNRTDTMIVQFSGPINVASLCSTWSGDTTNQTVNGNSVVGVTIREGTGGANDYVQVSTSAAACGGAFKFGTVTLGNDTYLQSTTTQTFRGTGTNQSTIAYNAATYTLTITLGINETTPGDDGSNNVTANTIATYAPGAITGTGGVAITGTGATANVRQF